jgi:hypothetical protein
MLSAGIQGVAFWSPACPDWPHAAEALRCPNAVPVPTLRRPAPTWLGANERRRAPEAVLMALQVAQDACAAAGVEPASLPSVFSSAHGDLAIVDALCRSLAQDPLLLSPMRFHHSVHNATSGYWAIGCGSREASTAVACGPHSFAAGLLEALTQSTTEDRTVLLVGCDTEAMGPLLSVTSSRGLLAVGLVLGPPARGGRRLRASLTPGPQSRPALRSATARALQANAMSDALSVFECLADNASTVQTVPLSDTLGLRLQFDAA